MEKDEIKKKPNLQSSIDSRRRHRKPYTLLAIGMFFIILPAVNIIANLTLYQSLQWQHLRNIDSLTAWRIFLIMLPIFVGIGILSVSRLGWWFFICYAIFLAIYNVASLLIQADGYDLGALSQVIISFTALGYFLRKDIYAPYLEKGKRGWRSTIRHRYNLPIMINGQELVTKNISDKGCYVLTDQVNFKENQQVEVVFPDFIKTLSPNLIKRAKNEKLMAGVTRVDSQGFGLAFRSLSKGQRSFLKRQVLLMQKENG